tara:strand:- start:47 stop:502 length:456 start_codon:yes stop_codon:yes gene_type:complete
MRDPRLAPSLTLNHVGIASFLKPGEISALESIAENGPQLLEHDIFEVERDEGALDRIGYYLHDITGTDTYLLKWGLVIIGIAHIQPAVQLYKNIAIEKSKVDLAYMNPGFNDQVEPAKVLLRKEVRRLDRVYEHSQRRVRERKEGQIELDF